MAQQEQTFIEFRTTWVFLALKLFCWLKIMRLIKILDNAIIARIYIDGKSSQKIKLNITDKNQVNIRINSIGGQIKFSQEIKL